jgi:hypothetical protein
MSQSQQLPKLSPQERHDIEQGATPHDRLRQALANQHPVHDEFAKAYNNLGGTVGLTDWAQMNQTDFYKMFAKLAPTPQAVKHSGEVKISLSLQRNPHLDGAGEAEEGEFREP